MSALLLQYVIAVSSVLTATMMIYIAKEAHQTHQTVYQNEQRSTVNRAVLREEGLVGPAERHPESDT